MRQVVHLGNGEVMPDTARLLRGQGMPARSELPERTGALLDVAVALFAELAEARGLLEDVTVAEFDEVHHGEGQNHADSPLPAIFPRARGLALFAATLGQPLSQKVEELFRENDLALGYMLDAVASDGAERLSVALGRRFLETLPGQVGGEETRVLSYSPGYCGWHISGQGRLFGRLLPQEIGIELNASFLMTPLKSVSGVLVAGPGEIHRFRATFPFCETCTTHDCGERMASVLRH